MIATPKGYCYIWRINKPLAVSGSFSLCERSA